MAKAAPKATKKKAPAKKVAKKTAKPTKKAAPKKQSGKIKGASSKAVVAQVKQTAKAMANVAIQAVLKMRAADKKQKKPTKGKAKK